YCPPEGGCRLWLGAQWAYVRGFLGQSMHVDRVGTAVSVVVTLRVAWLPAMRPRHSMRRSLGDSNDRITRRTGRRPCVSVQTQTGLAWTTSIENSGARPPA